MIPTKEIFLVILMEVQYIFRFLFLGSIMLVVEELRNYRFGYIGTEILSPRTFLVSFLSSFSKHGAHGLAASIWPNICS